MVPTSMLTGVGDGGGRRGRGERKLGQWGDCLGESRNQRYNCSSTVSGSARIAITLVLERHPPLADSASALVVSKCEW